LQYLFKDYAPIIFYRLRQLSGISTEQYLVKCGLEKSLILQNALHAESFLGNLKNQNFSEGKSGSFFCFSPDNNFIMKTIDISEVKVLREILPSYYDHLASNPHSLLTRLYGLHSVKIQNNVEIFVLLMGNLFNTSRKIHEKYDLKVIKLFTQEGNLIVKGILGSKVRKRTCR
jgi:1-phosphatidylinositol-4-phosphate 5-kinase